MSFFVLQDVDVADRRGGDVVLVVMAHREGRREWVEWLDVRMNEG